jgi:hypothetical protein
VGVLEGVGKSVVYGEKTAKVKGKQDFFSAKQFYPTITESEVPPLQEQLVLGLSVSARATPEKNVSTVRQVRGDIHELN